MKQVKFTQMKDGDKEDYILLKKYEDTFSADTSKRIMTALKNLDKSLGGYQVSRLEHSLQTATRAFKDGASEEMVVASLLHDIGDELAPQNHSEFAASIIRPYVSEKTTWIVEKHGIFQMYYYAHHYDHNKDQRDKYKGHKYFSDCANFCEIWDQASFDPSYNTIPLKDFEPMVHRIFNREPFKFL